MRKNVCLFICGLMAFSASCFAQTDRAPVFVNGTSQTLHICENAGMVNIGPTLAIVDSDTAQTETWSIAAMPVHGILRGFDTSARSTGGEVIPMGLTYMPDSGYSGTDSFIVRVSDSTDSAFTRVMVTVNANPVAVTPGNQRVCNNAAIMPIVFTGTSGATYVWTNSDTAIGLAARGSGDIAAFTARDTSTHPDTAIITLTAMASGCSDTVRQFTIVVNPTPRLTSSLMPTPICDSTLFTYIPNSATSGTAITWSRDSVMGISNAAASGTGAINEILIDTTANPVTVIYIDTLKANGCINTEDISLIVKPRPTLIPTLFPDAICDSTAFIFVPTSATYGTLFSWSRAAVTGIRDTAASDTGRIDEILINTTPNPIAVTYIDTLSAMGCVNTAIITVTVNPMPMLSGSTAFLQVCDSSLFTYVAMSATPGVSFSWTRAAVLGISTPAASGGDTINEILHNVSDNPIVVNYVFTLSAYGCTNTQTLAVTVNPTPLLNSPLVASICDSGTFNYNFASLTTGTVFSWTRDTVTGIGNPAVTDTGSIINESLVNNTNHPITVPYTATLTINGCTHMQEIMVTVNPHITMSSTLAPPAICDSTAFVYIPTTTDSGATFTYERPYTLGIGNLGMIGGDTINEVLHNITPDPIPVTYIITETIGGCSSRQYVTLTVNPSAILSSRDSLPAICNGTAFTYSPASMTTGTTFTWTRAQFTGITPATGSGSGAINEVLNNSASGQLTAVYVYTLTANGCSHSQDVRVAINPQVPSPAIAGVTSSNVCDNTYFQNFGTATAPAAGQKYTWSVQNAAISDTGNTNQYILVNFKNPGQAVVMLSVSSAGSECTGTTSVTVNVSGASADAPAQVIYFNNELICLQNNETAYQWGYDDVNTLAPTVLAGEINQDYINASLNGNNYWVMVTDNGCTQKAYYNKPANATMRIADTEVNVYPNPAHDNVQVTVKTSAQGNMQAELVDMMGRKVAGEPVTNNNATINLAGLPAGVYILNCYLDGNRIGATRITKD